MAVVLRGARSSLLRITTVANTDTKLLIYSLFQKSRVLAQDDVGSERGDAGMCPEVRGKRTAPSTPSSGYQIRRQPPRVREPRSDVGSRRCVVVESGQEAISPNSQSDRGLLAGERRLGFRPASKFAVEILQSIGRANRFPHGTREFVGCPGAAMYRAQARQLARTLPGATHAVSSGVTTTAPPDHRRNNVLEMARLN